MQDPANRHRDDLGCTGGCPGGCLPKGTGAQRTTYIEVVRCTPPCRISVVRGCPPVVRAVVREVRVGRAGRGRGKKKRLEKAQNEPFVKATARKTGKGRSTVLRIGELFLKLIFDCG